MKLLTKLSIKQKIIFIILIVTIISISISTVLSILSSAENLKKEVVGSQHLNAVLIAENCVTTLMFNDQEGAVRILQTLNKIPDIQCARIYDMDSVLFASYECKKKALKKDTWLKQNYYKSHKDQIRISEPIYYQDTQYGTLSILLSTKSLETKLRRNVVMGSINLLISILVAVILASLFQRLVSKPIILLAQFAEKITISKNYKLRIDKNTQDETGTLYDRFNSVLQTVDEYQLKRDNAEKELLIERESLEERVRIRTIELEVAKLKAEESDRLKSAFLANLSHEIRTPMNGIIGFGNLLLDPDIETAERIEYVRTVNACSLQLLSIITDILEISKIEANLTRINNEPIDIDTLSSDLHKELSINQYRKDNVKFQFVKSSAVLSHKMSADKTKLKQVLTNLLINAFKFTSEGSVEFGYKKVNDSYLEFFVRDTGSGIDKSNHKMIFERFRQVKNAAGKIQSGSGLGLAISKAYVEMMGGNIRIESELNVGTVFFFTIPIKTV